MLKRNVLHIDAPFAFEAGGSIPSMDILYYTSDRERRPGDKVVWVCHALTGNADPTDWWPDMVGEGKLFDPSEVFVVCVSMLGSAYGLCGPAATNPSTGKPWLLDFPKITIRDMVRAIIKVREHLGIESIDVLLGPSIGGFQASEWALAEPERIKNLVLIATSVRALPWLVAFNESQRMAMLADRSFKEAKDLNGGLDGLRCARSIALISYRSSEGYNRTQPEKDPDFLFADRAASYQRYQGEKLVTRGFDAYSYWYLTYALDSMNIGRGRGGEAAALSGIKAACTVVSISTDGIFPPNHGREFASLIPGASFHEIDSAFGHDGFFIENERLTKIIEPILNK